MLNNWSFSSHVLREGEGGREKGGKGRGREREKDRGNTEQLCEILLMETMKTKHKPTRSSVKSHHRNHVLQSL